MIHRRMASSSEPLAKFIQLSSKWCHQPVTKIPTYTHFSSLYPPWLPRSTTQALGSHTRINIQFFLGTIPQVPNKNMVFSDTLAPSFLCDIRYSLWCKKCTFLLAEVNSVYVYLYKLQFSMTFTFREILCN